jgi:DNA adenine methylase
MPADHHERLGDVTIEHPPWASPPRCERPETPLYLDPLYHGGESDYCPGVFTRDDLAAMAQPLARIDGHFIPSINDTPEIRETFAGVHLLPVTTTDSIGGAHGANEPARELLITNRDQAPPA